MCMQRSGQPGPDTQKHHQLYRGRRLDRHHYHRRYHHYETPPPPRNTWRRLYRGERDAGRGGKRGRFFKSSHQGSILAWLNARAPHIESDLTRPRVFVGRPLSSSKFNYRYEREIYFCPDPALLLVSYHSRMSTFFLLYWKKEERTNGYLNLIVNKFLICNI